MIYYYDYCLGQKYSLIDWEEESTSLVVPSLQVSEGTFTVEEVAWVKTPGGRFRGRVISTGTCIVPNNSCVWEMAGILTFYFMITNCMYLLKSNANYTVHLNLYMFFKPILGTKENRTDI